MRKKGNRFSCIIYPMGHRLKWFIDIYSIFLTLKTTIWDYNSLVINRGPLDGRSAVL